MAYTHVLNEGDLGVRRPVDALERRVRQDRLKQPIIPFSLVLYDNRRKRLGA